MLPGVRLASAILCLRLLNFHLHINRRGTRCCIRQVILLTIRCGIWCGHLDSTVSHSLVLPNWIAYSPGLDCGNKPPSYVVSISYHFEPDYPDPTNARILERVCAEYGKVSPDSLLTTVVFRSLMQPHAIAQPDGYDVRRVLRRPRRRVWLPGVFRERHPSLQSGQGGLRRAVPRLLPLRHRRRRNATSEKRHRTLIATSITFIVYSHVRRVDRRR